MRNLRFSRGTDSGCPKTVPQELDQKGKSYNGALQLLRDLSTGFLVPKAAGQRAQALHEEAQEPESHGLPLLLCA